MRPLPLLMLAALLLSAPARAGDTPPPAPTGYVFQGASVKSCTDGDTCRLDLHDSHPVFGKVTWREQLVRLIGLDTPELHPARCAEEKALGEKARDRLIALINGAKAVRVIVEGKRRDKYGRLLVRIEADGVDVAQTLIAEDLGRAYNGGRRKGWC